MATPIDPRPLLDWPIPEARQRYDARDTAFYALSVGVGHDALDPLQAALVDPWNDGLQPLPAMALVLGYPGFWLGDPELARVTGITPARILHVEQSIELAGPLPASGHVVGRTRVRGLVDKGEGRGALLYSERVVTAADDGRPMARVRQTHMLRGCGGFGGSGAEARCWPEGFEPPRRRPAPSGAPQAGALGITRPEQALLYRLNGDANRLHVDPQVAGAAGFERPILHGMATLGFACHALVAAALDGDPARLAGMTARMSAIVYPGETLRTDIWPDGAFRTTVAERGIVVLDDGFFWCRTRPAADGRPSEEGAGTGAGSSPWNDSID